MAHVLIDIWVMTAIVSTVSRVAYVRWKWMNVGQTHVRMEAHACSLIQVFMCVFVQLISRDLNVSKRLIHALPIRVEMEQPVWPVPMPILMFVFVGLVPLESIAKILLMFVCPIRVELMVSVYRVRLIHTLGKFKIFFYKIDFSRYTLIPCFLIYRTKPEIENLKYRFCPLELLRGIKIHN